MSRVIYLGPQAQRLIRPMLLNDLDAYIFSPSRALRELAVMKRQRRKTRVQPSQLRRDQLAKPRDLGDHYTTCSYARAIAYACDRAFPHLHVESGYPAVIVLGHTAEGVCLEACVAPTQSLSFDCAVPCLYPRVRENTPKHCMIVR